MRVDSQYLKELGLSDNDISVLETPKKEKMDSEVSFDGLNKTNEKKFDVSIKPQGLISMKSDKKDIKSK
jgi:hypothetical protein